MRHPVAARRDDRVRKSERPSESAHWASNIGGVTQFEAEILCQAARVLYPHDWLDDITYRTVVLGLVRAAADDDTASLRLRAILDELAKGRFDSLSEEERITFLKRIEGSDAFRYLQSSALYFLYNDPIVWAGCGYEGVEGCSETGIRAGINELDWLPEPTI